jgi:hypothetical protein
VVRRRVPLAEFDAERNEDVARVVRVLTDRRLLTVSEGVVEVAHEALLREWPRVRGWLEEDRAGRVLHSHLIDTARGWAERTRPRRFIESAARVRARPTTDHTPELNEPNASSERELRHERKKSRTPAPPNRRLRGCRSASRSSAGAGGVVSRSCNAAGRGVGQAADAQRPGAQAVVRTS